MSRVLLIIVGVLFGVAPQVLTPYELSIAMTAIATAVLALAVHLHTTICGLPTLGAVAWSAAGAFTAAHLSGGLFAALPLQLLAGAVGGLAVAVLTAPLVIGSTGLTTIMITLGVAELLRTAAVHWRQMIGGTDGHGITARPLWPGQPPVTDHQLYLALLLVLALVAAGLSVWLRSPSGRALAGIADNRWRMQAAGWNITAHLHSMHLAAGGIGGLAGAMMLAAHRYASPADASMAVSALVLAAAVIGASAGLPGVIAAAIVLVAVRDWLGVTLPGAWSGHGGVLLAVVLLAAAYLPALRLRRSPQLSALAGQALERALPVSARGESGRA